MGRKKDKTKESLMKEISIRYETGQAGVSALARQYNIDRSNLFNYFKKNGIKPNPHAKAAYEKLSEGFSELTNVINPIIQQDTTANQSTAGSSNDINANLSQQNNNNTTQDKIQAITSISKVQEHNIELANEIVEMVKRRNPQFAQSFHALSALMIKRSKEILERPDIKSGDLQNISKAMLNMNDTLGVFPKMPTIAQQFNIGKNENKKTNLQPLDIEIKFI